MNESGPEDHKILTFKVNFPCQKSSESFLFFIEECKIRSTTYINDTFVSCHFWSTLFTNIEPKFQTLISKRTGFDAEVAEKFFNGIYCVDISCLMQCYLLWKVSFIFKVQKEKKRTEREIPGCTKYGHCPVLGCFYTAYSFSILSIFYFFSRFLKS